MSKTKELERTTEPVVNGVVHGYRARVTTRRITATEEAVKNDYLRILVAAMAPEEGHEPFWCEVRSDLTFAELDSLQVMRGTPYQEQWEAMAPWIVAWNATAFTRETGEVEPVPPPAEIGVDAFRTQRALVTEFLAICIKLWDGTDLPKGLNTTGDTDDGEVATN